MAWRLSTSPRARLRALLHLQLLNLQKRSCSAQLRCCKKTIIKVWYISFQILTLWRKAKYNINLALLTTDSDTTVQGSSQGLVTTDPAQNDAEDDFMMLDGPPPPSANVEPETSSNASESAIQNYDMVDRSAKSPPTAGSSSSPPLSRPRRELKVPAKYKDSKMLLGKKSYNPLAKRWMVSVGL
jgi:hypothetical protein